MPCRCSFGPRRCLCSHERVQQKVCLSMQKLGRVFRSHRLCTEPHVRLDPRRIDTIREEALSHRLANESADAWNLEGVERAERLESEIKARLLNL
eukprot:3792195-Pleurochrysis_carterae.AAC.1